MTTEGMTFSWRKKSVVEAGRVWETRHLHPPYHTLLGSHFPPSLIQLNACHSPSLVQALWPLGFLPRRTFLLTWPPFYLS